MTPFPQQSQCLCSPRLSKPPRPSTRTFAKNTMMFCRSVSRSSRKRWSSKPPCNCQVFDIEDNLGRLNKVSPIYLLSLVAFHSFTVISASLHFCSLFLFLYTPDIRTSSSSLSSVVLFLVFFFHSSRPIISLIFMFFPTSYCYWPGRAPSTCQLLILTNYWHNADARTALWPLFHHLLWQDVTTEHASVDANYEY